jgi:hypothetical protein
MILINKVTTFASETFQKDLIECISHNIDINSISTIVVFHNNSNIVLPKHDKVKLIIKNKYTDKDIIEYCKKITTDDIFIFSNPFIKFNNTLNNLEKPISTVNKIGNDCFIFNRNEKIIGDSIEDIFQITTQNNKITVNRKHLWTKEIKIQSLVNKQVSTPLTKIDVVIVSVDYNDFLSITINSIVNLFNITVVTSPNDITCQELCKKYGVNCVITERMYENGAIFNKGKAINEGLKSIKNPDWILLLDADIYLKPDFLDVVKNSNLNINSLVMCKRLIIDNGEDFTKWKNGENVGQLERSKGYGYFQMFNANCQSNRKFFYSEEYTDASESDLEFRDRFKIKSELDTYVVHLGDTGQNWSGRVTEKFTDILLEGEKKSKIINHYNKPLDKSPEYFETVNISSNKDGKKILFLMYLNDIGGAEYVSYQHIKACKELGYHPVVLSADKGMFFNKIKDLDVDLYYSKLYDIDINIIIEILYNLSNDCEIVYNCNYFGITPHIKTLKELRRFKYYTIAHSDIEWVVNSIFDYDEITDKYIVIHDKIRDELNKKGVCNTRILTMPNYIDYKSISNNVETFNNRTIKDNLGIKESDFVVGMVTRISPDKNILDSIKIISQLNFDNIKLLIVGDSPNTTESQPYKKEVLDYIKHLKLENKVIISGHINNDDVYKYISTFNISLNNSPSEGLPISLLEQMACGIHCVYPSHGEIPLVLEGYGSVIEIKQRKSFNKNDEENYIFSRFRDDEILLFVNEINKLYNFGVLEENKIKEQIEHNRSYEKCKYYLDYLYGGYKKGTSFVIRARNEQENVEICLTSIVDIADEIVFVDHLSTDKTYDIAFELSKKYNNIKVFKYTREVPKAGINYKNNIKSTGNSLSSYYNFCLSKSTRSTIVKWDADFIANIQNLKDMIKEFDLPNRDDKFSLWFSGETLFIKSDEMYINKESYYDEYRSFSALKGVKWVDADRCEYIDRDYANSSIPLKYNEPCFYEIKRVEIDEFISRDGLIDIRDKQDFEIIENLKCDIISEKLKKIESLND